MLLGHEHPKAEELSGGIIKHGPRYSLPRLTEVKVAVLTELLSSDVVINQCQIDWKKGIIKNIEEKMPVEDVVKLLQNDINKFLNFTCTGPSGRLANTTESNTASPIANQCGWYPKSEHTHPIVLLGSPGTSKSTVMMSGLVTFYNTIGTLGSYIVFNTPDGTQFFDQRASSYWKGDWPEPTKAGERHSIQLSVIPTDPNQNPPLKPQNFVFTDIPGETTRKLLTTERSDSVLLGILKNAGTIVIFFDLSVEASFRQFVADNHRPQIQEVWKDTVEHFKYISKPREEGDEGSKVNRAKVDQYHIVAKLITAIRENQLIANDQKLQCNCVCVIPKSDLYADFGSQVTQQEEGSQDKKDMGPLNNHTLFMTDFYHFLYKKAILSDPTGAVPLREFKDTGGVPVDLEPFHSQGGIGSEFTKAEGKSKLSIQEDIINQIKEQALLSIRNISHATSLNQTSQDLNINGEVLKQSVEMRLIQLLYRSFHQEKVYFLPVSAAGRRLNQSEQDQRTEKGEEGKSNIPRQKLSEYVFLLPVILAYSDQLRSPAVTPASQQQT